MHDFVLYIDEAGDEGFGKLKNSVRNGGQSEWLLLGALIVRQQNDLNVPAWKRDLILRFPNKKKMDLHWRNLNHDQRIVVARHLSALPLKIGIVASHKVTIPGSKHESTFKQKGYLYNYLTRWLLERTIDFCRLHAKRDICRIKVVFSKRRNTDYEHMKDYITMLKEGRDLVKSPRCTDWSCIDINAIEVENHSKRAGLQLCDCVTSAFFNGLERNVYGNIEPAYALTMAKKLMIDQNGRSKNAGLTIVPSLVFARPDDEQKQFIEACWK